MPMTMATTASPRSAAFLTVKHIGLLFSTTLGTAFLAFLTNLLLTRGLSMQAYGRLAALLAAINVATPIASIGLGWFWLDLFGREGRPAVRWIQPALRLSAVATGLAAALLLLYATATGTDRATGFEAGLLLIPVLLGQTLVDTTAARFQLEERYAALACWQLVTQAGRSLVAFGLLASGVPDMLALLAGYALVGLIVFAVSWASVRRVARAEIHFAGHPPAERGGAGMSPQVWDVLVQAMPYSLMTLFYLLGSQAIVSVVDFQLGSTRAAVYNVAYMVTALVYLFPSVVYGKYLSSKILRWSTHDRPMFVAVFHVAFAAHVIIGIASAALVLLLGPVVIPFVFGARYGESAQVLAILAYCIPLRFAQHAYGSLMLSKEHIRRKISYMACSSGACVALVFVLTPAFGLRGAAYAALVAEIMVLVLYAYGASRHVDGIQVIESFRPSGLRRSFMHVYRHGKPGDGVELIRSA